MKLVNIEDLKSSAEKLQSSSLWSSTNEEEWRDVVSFPSLFEVSSLGNFRRKGKLENLAQHINAKGYKLIATQPNGRKNVGKTFRIHREVALAFIENIDSKPQVNHKNGNKQDNRVENLEWCTNQENMVHARDNNLLNIKKGSENSRYWITDELVLQIYKEVTNTEMSLRSVCIKYNTHHSSISRRYKQLNDRLERQA